MATEENTQVQLTEQEDRGILALGTGLAADSLCAALIARSGYWHALTMSYYSTTTLLKGTSMNNKAGGQIFPMGLDAFVEEELEKSACIGLVPITREVCERLKQLNLRPMFKGLKLVKERYQAALFR